MITNAVKSFSRVLFQALLLAACIFTFLLPIKNSAAQAELIPNEFIFQVLLPPKWFISEAVFAYEYKGKYYLPISEFSRDLAFFVEAESGRQYASGFAGGEDNRFTIDAQRGELTFRGEKESVSSDVILAFDDLATDDVYVQLEVLNKIWPVEMSLDLSTLTVIIEAEEDLPFMQRKERQDKAKKLEERQAVREERKRLLPRRENPYSLFGKPVIDFQGTYTYDDEEDNLTGTSVFTGVQQLGKLLADFSATFTHRKDFEIDEPSSVRLKLSRKSAGEEYLVPGVRNVEFGDVSLRQRELISNTESGRGVFVSNDNRDRFNEFDRITVEGTGPPGWDIELYNNDELIDFGVVPDDGEFFFEDVILNFGSNQIRLLFFGPQGQVREELRTHNAGGNMLSPGDLLYNVGFLDHDRDFILLDNDPRINPRGVVKTGEVSYGINRWLTVFGNYTDIPQDDKDRSYVTAGASVSTPIGLAELETYNEIGGGNAIALDYITNFFDIRTNINLARFNDFESDDAGFGSSRKTYEASAQFNKQFKVFSIPLGLRLNTTHTERKTGVPVTAIDTAQTISRSGLRFTHSTTSRFSDFVHDTTSAGASATWRADPWQLRGNLNYEIHPEFDLTSVNSELRYRTGNKFQGAINAGHSFTTSDYNFGLQLGYDFDTVLGTIESNYDRGEGWDFVLRATTSLNPYTPDGSYTVTSRQKRQFAPINANIFLDRNHDGEFGEEDEPLENARLIVGQSSSKTATTEDGLILVNAPEDKITNFRVDPSSLEDPYFLPATEGFSTVPTRGGVIQASFPVIETGAVEGSVFREDNNRAIPGLTLELFDEAGEKVDEVVTAFDGYYAIEFVRPGTYSIQANPTHGVTILENMFTLTPQDLFLYGNDLYIHIPQTARNTAPAANEIYGPFLNNEDPVVNPDEMPADILQPFEDVEPAAGEITKEVFGPENLSNINPVEVEPVNAVPAPLNPSDRLGPDMPQKQTPEIQQQDTPGGLYSLLR